ncbi:Uma2 family endonuclease [Enterovirga rhinocerotis]|uniref:Uma2 family endonuclease n=1 Tax=Enterovirga rhinocerotis TaxID=1339210 RepID=A0A4R7BS72_9HYPH|nr:Uma2 family endonuclease [Enterovirga rhinocerotis]TDR87315.1 Uma2 family endonuclease [Enterovirga rhinocerotis]
MSQALAKRPHLSVADFIEMIRPFPDEERWELLDGEPVLMAPQTERHQTVVMNLLRRIDGLAARRGCRVLPGLGLLNENIDDYAPIPDVVVRCGPPVEGGYAKDPVLLAEVLSPSTMSNDRGRKLDFYRTIASLRTILVVYQDEARIEAWQREGADWRHAVLKDPAAILPLPELGGDLRLADIYEGIGPLI